MILCKTWLPASTTFLLWLNVYFVSLIISCVRPFPQMRNVTCVLAFPLLFYSCASFLATLSLKI